MQECFHPAKCSDAEMARCNYVAYLWKHAHLRDPLTNMQPTDHGWKEDNGVFLPLWFTGSHMPNVLSETMDPTDVSDGKDGNDDNDEKRSINHLFNQNVPCIHL